MGCDAHNKRQAYYVNQKNTFTLSKLVFPSVRRRKENEKSEEATYPEVEVKKTKARWKVYGESTYEHICTKYNANIKYICFSLDPVFILEFTVNIWNIC